MSDRVSVWLVHYDFGIVAYLDRADCCRSYHDVTRSSRVRLADVVSDLVAGDSWQMRPHMLREVGWVARRIR